MFPSAEMLELENALVFPAADPVMAYYKSGPVDNVREPTADTRRNLLAPVGELVGRRIADAGEFRVPKRLICYLAVSP